MRSLKSDRRKLTATNLLIISFILVFAFEMYQLLNFGQPALENLVQLYAFKETEFFAGQYYRVFTSIFLHAGLIHLGSNSGILYLAGNPLERRIGSVKFFFLFLLSGVAGSLLTAALLDVSKPAIGASGGVFGVLAAAALLIPTKSYLEEIPILRKFSLPVIRVIFSISIIAVYFVFQEAVMASLQAIELVNDNVGHIAHFGGIMTGLILSYLWYPDESIHSAKYSVVLLVLLTSLVLVPPMTQIWYGVVLLNILFLLYWRRKRVRRKNSF